MKGSMERMKSSLKLGQMTAFLKDCLSDSRKRIYVYIISGILLLAVLLGSMAALKSRSSKELSGTLGEGEKKAAQSLTYLPDTEREKEGQGNDSTASLRDPFTGAVVLKGIIKGGDKDFAIIEAGQVAYVVSKGDAVAGIWTVKGIEKDGVVLASGKQELRLGFGGRLKSASGAGAAGEAGSSRTEGGEPRQSRESAAGRNGGEF